MRGAQARDTGRTPPWRERVGGGEVAAAFFLYLALSAAVVGFLVGPDGSLPLLAAGGFLAAVVSVWAVVRLSPKASAASVGLVPASARWVLVGAGLGALGWLSSVAIGELYFRAFGDYGDPRPGFAAAVGEASPLELALLSVVASTLAPFAEELLYRGMLYTYLRRWGAPVAVAGSAVVFGLTHDPRLSAVTFSTAAVGAVCALAYELSGSLWPAVAAHAAMNATASAVSWFGS